jgi:hypothetical protein
MKITIVPSMRWIKTDEESLNIPEWNFNDTHIERIEWENGEGTVEFKQDSIVNTTFNDVSILQPYLDALESYTEKSFPDVTFDETKEIYVLNGSSTAGNDETLNNILNSQNDLTDQDKEAWIYIHIPKTAGTFIKSRIKESIETSKILDPFVNNNIFSIPIKNAPRISFVKKYIELSNDERVKFISIVRNPYDRIYSLWKWSRVYGLPGNLEFPEVETNFNDFAISLSEGNYDHYYFMQRQTFFLNGYDERLKIIKFEDLNTQGKSFFEQNGVKWSNQKLNDINGERYVDVYTEESMKAIQERCLEEFEMFEYSTDLI